MAQTQSQAALHARLAWSLAPLPHQAGVRHLQVQGLRGQALSPSQKQCLLGREAMFLVERRLPFNHDGYGDDPSGCGDPG